jgi:hypothetical protein
MAEFPLPCPDGCLWDAVFVFSWTCRPITQWPVVDHFGNTYCTDFGSCPDFLFCPWDHIPPKILALKPSTFCVMGRKLKQWCPQNPKIPTVPEFPDLISPICGSCNHSNFDGQLEPMIDPTAAASQGEKSCWGQEALPTRSQGSKHRGFCFLFLVSSVQGGRPVERQSQFQ